MALRSALPGALLALVGCAGAPPRPSVIAPTPVPITSVRSATATGFAVETPGHQPAIFVDAGGVILRTDFVPTTADDVDRLLIPEALDGFALLARVKNAAIVVVTNQGGIDLGEVSDEAVRAVLARLALRVQERGGRIDAVYYCPASKETSALVGPGEVSGRKPAPGMLFQAAKDLGPAVDLADSIMVGDNDSDFVAGKAAHPSLLVVGVNTGAGPVVAQELETPELVTRDLSTFAAWYLARERGSREDERAALASSEAAR